jgi:hypothetical protein
VHIRTYHVTSNSGLYPYNHSENKKEEKKLRLLFSTINQQISGRKEINIKCAQTKVLVVVEMVVVVVVVVVKSESHSRGGWIEVRNTHISEDAHSISYWPLSRFQLGRGTHLAAFVSHPITAIQGA